MEDKRELVVFDSCGKSIDAEFIKGTLDSCGIKTSIVGDQIGTELGSSFVKVVILRDDLEKAIKAVFSSDIQYEDYNDFLTHEEFDIKQQCNKVFCQLALKLHPGFYDGKDRRKSLLYEKVKVAYYDNDLKFLAEMNNLLSKELGLPLFDVPLDVDTEGEPMAQPSGEIRGWLVLFVIFLFALGIIKILDALSVFFALESLHGLFVAPLELKYMDVTISPIALLVLMILSSTVFFYPAYTILRRKPNAIFWGKAAMIYLLLNSFESLFFLIPEFFYVLLSLIIIWILLSITWLIYLKFSDQVNRLFPHEYLRIDNDDWVLLFVLFILSLGLLPGSIFAAFSSVIINPDIKVFKHQKDDKTDK